MAHRFERPLAAEMDEMQRWAQAGPSKRQSRWQIAWTAMAAMPDDRSPVPGRRSRCRPASQMSRRWAVCVSIPELALTRTRPASSGQVCHTNPSTRAGSGRFDRLDRHAQRDNRVVRGAGVWLVEPPPAAPVARDRVRGVLVQFGDVRELEPALDHRGVQPRRRGDHAALVLMRGVMGRFGREAALHRLPAAARRRLVLPGVPPAAGRSRAHPRPPQPGAPRAAHRGPGRPLRGLRPRRSAGAPPPRPRPGERRAGEPGHALPPLSPARRRPSALIGEDPR